MDEKVINSLQDVMEQIVGIEYAPHLGDYPTSLDNLVLPCSLIDVTENSQWFMDCRDNRAILNLRINVFIERFESGFYGPSRVKVAELANNVRNKFYDSNTYLYADSYQKLIIEESDIVAYINPGQPFTYSGFQGNLNYPVGSTNFFKGFTVDLQIVTKGDNNC